MEQSPNNQKANRIFEVLKRDYTLVGRRHIKAWHAWLVIGLTVGVAAGVVLVANRSGEFERGEAAIDPSQGSGIVYPYPPADILYHNSAYNYGWFYIAQTVPQNNKTFWLAAVRSDSTEPSDTSAHLLYGITDLETGRYSQGILHGTFAETKDSVALSFNQQDGQPILRFRENTTYISKPLASFTLEIALPLAQTLGFREPILYESGDGVVPMAPGLNSLYVSLAPLGDTYWADFQKFKIGSLSAGTNPLAFMRGSVIGGIPNHRWGSIILNRDVGSLPRGTAIVYWDIFDEYGNRQPGGFTNIDILSPGGQQQTAGDFRITELEHWNSGTKTYLRKWRLTQEKLGVDLLMETITKDQEFKIPGAFNFYEGAVLVRDPKDSAGGAVVGSGMWEQTHDESKDK